MKPLTWNANQRQNADGSKTTELHAKWINFLDGQQRFQAIDLPPIVDSTAVRIESAPCSMFLPKRAAGAMRFESTNRFDLVAKKARRDQPTGATKRYPTAQNVVHTVTPEGVLYRNAFPDLKADLLIQPHEQELRHLVVFRSEPPGAGAVRIPIEIDFDGLKPIYGKTQRELGTSNTDLSSGFFVSTGGFRGIGIKAPLAWDSAHPIRRKYLNVKLVGRMIGNTFVGEKVIPRSFFKGIVYPAFADTTSTFNPAAGAVSPVDGFVRRAVPPMVA